MPLQLLHVICALFFFEIYLLMLHTNSLLGWLANIFNWQHLLCLFMITVSISQFTPLSKSSTQIWIVPSDNVRPGGLSLYPFNPKPVIELSTRSIASGSRNSRVPPFYFWPIGILPPFNLSLFWLVGLKIFSLTCNHFDDNRTSVSWSLLDG